MRVQRESSGQILVLDPGAELGAGGEARIYAAPPNGALAAKIYHRPDDAPARKLAVMIAHPPLDPVLARGHSSIAWPVDMLREVGGRHRVVGFLMPRVRGLRPLVEFYNPKLRRQKCPFFDYRYLHRTARNLAAAVGAVHARGHVVGDLNESNVLASDTALVTLVDTDSFQVREPQTGAIHRCPVGKPEFTPPELQGKAFRQLDRSPEHDAFGLAVLIFQLLMEGAHPFAGIVPGHEDPPPLEARIAAGRFPHRPPRSAVFSVGRRAGGPSRPNPLAPPFEILHPGLRRLFVRCFADGHRRPRARPGAHEWQRTLEEAEQALVTCSANEQHCSGRHLRVCPWCERAARLGGRDPFPSRRPAPAATGPLSPVAGRRPPRRPEVPPAPPPALPLVLLQPGPGLSAGTALLAGAAFRGWCAVAVPPVVTLNACGWSWRSVLAQASGLALLRVLWALFGERRAWTGFLAKDFRRNLLLWCLLGVLLGAARWVWYPMDFLDRALRPLALLCGMPAAWGFAAAILSIVVTGERRSPATQVPASFRRGTRRGAAAALCVLIAAHGFTALVRSRGSEAASVPVPASRQAIFSPARPWPRRSTPALAAHPVSSGPEPTAARRQDPPRAAHGHHPAALSLRRGTEGGTDPSANGR